MIQNKKVQILLIPTSLIGKKKNIVTDLLYGCWCQGKRIGGAQFPPLSLLSIRTVLKEYFKCSLLSSSMLQSPNLIQNLPLQRYRWCILPSSYTTIKSDLDFISQLKNKNPSLKVIIFGDGPTFSSNLIKDSVIDYGIIGEPEFAIRNLILSKEYPDYWAENCADLNGVIDFSKEDCLLIKTEPNYIQLDKLPFPDRTPIISYYYFNPLIRTKKWTTLLSSRGCPYRCIFCTSNFFFGKKYRANSPEYVLNEIKYLISLGFSEFFFRDETFTLDKDRVMKICDLILLNKLKIGWICNARINTVTKSMLIKMRMAGCHTIKFGVESGSQKVLDYLQKDITVLQIRYVFRLCKIIGFNTHAHIILNSPFENQKDFEITMQLLKEIKPDTVTFNQFKIFPGSPFFAKSVQNLNIENHNLFLIKKAYRSFYLRPSYIMGRVLKIKSWADLKTLIQTGLQIFSFIFDRSSGVSDFF